MTKKTAHHYRVEKKHIGRECPDGDQACHVQDYLEEMLEDGWALVGVDGSLFIFKAASKHQS